MVFGLLLVVCLGFAAQAGHQQIQRGDGWSDVVWQSLNAGAGGNIQGIFPDPNRPGRLYFISDMEGLYRSDDWAGSWRYIGYDPAYSYCQWVEVEPGNSDRLYLGTYGSLEISDDAGLTWERIDGIRDFIGQIAVRPDDPNVVYALPGKRYRMQNPFREEMPLIESGEMRGPRGERGLYISRDRGKSWDYVKYADAPGRRDGFSFHFDLNNPDIITIGTLTGVFRSKDAGKSWSKITSPTETGDCVGSCISPDGKTLYAVYRVPSDGKPAIVTTGGGNIGRTGFSHLFATPTDRTKWVNLSEEGTGFQLSDRDHTMYWRPRIDPRSKGSAHRLLVGTYRPQHGLWQVNIEWNDGKPTPAKWRCVLDYKASLVHPDYESVPFDVGWEHWGITAENYIFTPESWPGYRIYSTGGESAYVTDLTKEGWEENWEPIYTRRVQVIDGVPMYRTRGAHSLYTIDSAAYKNYAAHSVADNCLLESYDGGYSWTKETKPGKRTTSRSNQVHVFHEFEPPLVVAHIAIGWGPKVDIGYLYAKRLEHYSPKDQWTLIGGGPDNLANLPGGAYNCFAQDPNNPRRVLVGSRFRGVHMVDDIEALYEAAKAGGELPQFKNLTPAEDDPSGSTYYSAGLAFDPVDPTVVWNANWSHKPPFLLHRGRYDAAKKTVNWEPVFSIGKVDGCIDFALPVVNGKTVVVALADPEFDAVDGDKDNDANLVFSTDAGKSWNPLIRFEDVKNLVDRDYAWYKPELQMELRGLLADGDTLYLMASTDRKGGRRGYGIFKGTMTEEGITDVVDFTADLPWPYPIRSEILTVDGHKYLYLSTRGNGLYRRRLD